MIYLDYAATSLRKPAAVSAAVQEAMLRLASPGRGGYAAAAEAERAVYETRELTGALLGCAPERVCFTMNATHALNIAIRSVAGPGARVAVSGFEHNAVMRPLHALGARLSVAGTRLFAPEDTLRAFSRALRSGVDAVVCTQVSNVFGYRLPVEELAGLCRRYRTPLVIDASQAAGCEPIEFDALGAAYLAAPGHKGLLGPQGTGVLLCAADARPEPLLAGGTGSESASYVMPEFLPDRLEAGTPNVAGICGLREGVRYVLERTDATIGSHEAALRARLVRALQEIPAVRLFSGPDGVQTGVLSLQLRGMDCEVLAAALAGRGVCVRAGLHCAPRAHESAGTLREGTLRVSPGPWTTEEEIDEFVRILEELATGKFVHTKSLAIE